MLKPPRKNAPKTKKDLKEDKFVETVLNTKDYIERNYKQVMTYVLSVFIVLIAIMTYSYMSGRTSEEATTLFGKAQLEYQNFNYGKAKEMLIELTENFGGTEQGKQGMLFLANIYYQEKNYEQAKTTYSEFVDSYDGSRILLASGHAGYGACLELEEAFINAAEQYDQAVKTAPEFAEAANWLFLAGLNYSKAGEGEKAAGAFTRLIEEYPDSDRKFDAEAQLILMAKN